MRIEIEIPKEFENDYTGDRFKDFFARVLCDITRKGVMCGKYEKETAEMFIKAFDESKTAYDVEKVVEEINKESAWYRGFLRIHTEEAIDMAIKALEKQIAKKPIDRIAYYDCPCCGEVDIIGCLYCPVCGQKLDWSEV